MLSLYMIGLVPLMTQYATALAVAMPAVTAAPKRLEVRASTGPITFGPSFTMSSTVIGGTTYPLLMGGGQGGYNFVNPNQSATGLLGINAGNNYTTIGSQVFPILDLTVAEADTESVIIPGLLTFHDGGLQSTQKTDVLCTVNGNGAGCSGLVGIVTGAVLGQPFTNLGGIDPTLALPQSSGGTLSGQLSGYATIVQPGFTGQGQIGGVIITASGVTGVGGAGAESGVLAGQTAIGAFTGSYVVASGTTKVGGSLCEKAGPLPTLCG